MVTRLAAQGQVTDMKKQKQPHRKTGRNTAGKGRPAKSGPGNPASGSPVLSAEASPVLAAMNGKVPGPGELFRAGVRTRAFKVAFLFFLLGVATVAASLVIPHEFAFFELGYLFTLSIYDLVLAMLGLSVAIGMAGRRSEVLSIALAFVGAVAPMLLFFDPIFHTILQSPLGHELFLIAPVAVMLSGLTLWLPAGMRRFAAPLAAAVVGFSLSLFIGLDDFGIGIKEFASSAVLGALWILMVPGLMLRPFLGAWLTIPARIIGSWLMVIAVIVTVSLYVPFSPDAPPLPDPSLPEDGITLDAPTLLPLDPAFEEGLMDVPDGFDGAPPDSGEPVLDMGDNPLLGGGRNRAP
ncbi:hypothetical protein [Peteryoungia algae]|uniref:Uncharacterized protein n=1 Tax=Peteryoungia algae TaxID=2919917 RepID=A0ABT0CX77_9HYPH|nr:hypothetical protein [Rhizobium sp. SSM4.3]MCJ8237774.1 hypothetical protein [Rhizobium sp. SSM4.3]